MCIHKIILVMIIIGKDGRMYVNLVIHINLSIYYPSNLSSLN